MIKRQCKRNYPDDKTGKETFLNERKASNMPTHLPQLHSQPEQQTHTTMQQGNSAEDPIVID